MKLTIVSNYINHHQIPMADALYQKLGADFAFIQTSPMEEDRVKMGWGNEVRSIPYLKLYYEECERCARRILDSDIVVFGGVEDEGRKQRQENYRLHRNLKKFPELCPPQGLTVWWHFSREKPVQKVSC